MSLYQSEIRKPQIGDVYLMRFGGCGNEQKRMETRIGVSKQSRKST